MLSRLMALMMSFLLLWFAYPSATIADISSGKTTFIVYGDLPYMITTADGRSDEEVLYQDILPAIQQRDDVPFVIHVGDLSRPEYACDDQFLYKIKDFWEKDLQKPVFYTPGDNDWTDCDRSKLANPQSELERLAAIREIFFSEPKKLSPEWQYEQNSHIPEDELWVYDGVLFVSDHMVSTQNGREEVLKDKIEEALYLVDERDYYNEKWLDHAFDIAKNSSVEAVVIASQLDPFGPEDGVNDSFARCLRNPEYGRFCYQIQHLAAELAKPVLYVHGDTNAYCYDKPFLSGNIWRLNAPGDFKYIDASLISYDRSNPDIPFEVTGLLSQEAPPQMCDYSR